MPGADHQRAHPDRDRIGDAARKAELDAGDDEGLRRGQRNAEPDLKGARMLTIAADVSFRFSYCLLFLASSSRPRMIKTRRWFFDCPSG